MKECMRPHALFHSLSGVGVGFLLAGLINSLTGGTGVILGIVLIAVGLIGDMSAKGKK